LSAQGISGSYNELPRNEVGGIYAGTSENPGARMDSKIE